MARNDERDPDGEAAGIQPAADETGVRVQATCNVGEKTADTCHAPREPNDHRRQTEAADPRDQVGKRHRGARFTGRRGARERNAECEREQCERLRQRVADSEDTSPQLAVLPGG